MCLYTTDQLNEYTTDQLDEYTTDQLEEYTTDKLRGCTTDQLSESTTHQLVDCTTNQLWGGVSHRPAMPLTRCVDRHTRCESGSHFSISRPSILRID